MSISMENEWMIIYFHNPSWRQNMKYHIPNYCTERKNECIITIWNSMNETYNIEWCHQDDNSWPQSQLQEEQLGIIHSWDTTVKIPKPGNEAKATSWTAETERGHIRRVRGAATYWPHHPFPQAGTLRMPSQAYHFSSGKKRAKGEHQVLQFSWTLSGRFTWVSPYRDHWGDLPLSITLEQRRWVVLKATSTQIMADHTVNCTGIGAEFPVSGSAHLQSWAGSVSGLGAGGYFCLIWVARQQAVPGVEPILQPCCPEKQMQITDQLLSIASSPAQWWSLAREPRKPMRPPCSCIFIIILSEIPADRSAQLWSWAIGPSPVPQWAACFIWVPSQQAVPAMKLFL